MSSIIETPNLGNIIESIQLVQSNRVKVRKQEDDLSLMFKRLPIWKAIVSHVLGERCFLLHKPNDLKIRHFKGCGPAIRINKVSVTIDSCDVVVLDISITYNSTPGGPSYYEDTPDGGITKDYHISIPTDIVINFTEESFQNWIGEKEKEQRKEKLINLVALYQLEDDLLELALTKIRERKNKENG